jgi:heme exporter protein B
MSAFTASLRRELTLRIRQPAAALYPAAFAVLVALLIGFAVGANATALALIAPAALFIAMLLAVFLALDQLFAGDVSDGTLDALVCADHALLGVLFGKALGFWLASCATLLLALPVLMVLLKLPPGLAPLICLSLTLASLALSFLGLAGAALTARLSAQEGAGGTGGAMLLLLLVLPQAVPVLIFALGAVQAAVVGESPRSALYFLSALSCLYVTFAPFAARLALRVS